MLHQLDAGWKGVGKGKDYRRGKPPPAEEREILETPSQPEAVGIFAQAGFQAGHVTG
jgi:hypothetical protein